ncbi:four helix bundle protein [Membranihabitans maritimus]|uniref:four helix bundle protein n=1 Tax=Membranihabitans maritimus TaxID=2904244 RepID=UPI001F2F7122|nr:four helix bundle protein [Membranihabitans maritimus]
MRNFKELKIWKRSFKMANEIYKVTKSFPAEEKYALISQIRRSAVSIPSNIAEGCSRNSNKDLGRFVEIAIGSAFELETQLLIAKSQNFGNSKIDEIIDEINQLQKMMNAFKSKLTPKT